MACRMHSHGHVAPTEPASTESSLVWRRSTVGVDWLYVLDLEQPNSDVYFDDTSWPSLLGGRRFVFSDPDALETDSGVYFCFDTILT
jgi:hypothetical protein